MLIDIEVFSKLLFSEIGISIFVASTIYGLFRIVNRLMKGRWN